MNTWSRLAFEKNTIGIPGVHGLGGYNYVAARPGLAPHQHPGCVEISLMVKGHQSYRVEGEMYHLKGGEQFVTFPDELHDTGDQPEDKGSLYWLILNVNEDSDKFLFLAPPMARQLMSDLLGITSRHFVAAHESQFTMEHTIKALLQRSAPDRHEGVIPIYGNEYSAPGKNRKGRPLDDRLLLLQAASNIVNYITQTIAASRANIHSISPAIKASLDFIGKHGEEILNVAQLAKEVHMSESQFKILFREEVGIPPAEYMLREKVNHAKTLMSRPDCKIIDVAFQLGFSSSQYFATVFKRFANQTPSEFMHGQQQALIPVISNLGPKS